jgi:hypothetical protein
MAVMKSIAHVATIGVTWLMDTLLNLCAASTNLCGKFFLYSICSNPPCKMLSDFEFDAKDNTNFKTKKRNQMNFEEQTLWADYYVTFLSPLLFSFLTYLHTYSMEQSPS